MAPLRLPEADDFPDIHRRLIEIEPPMNFTKRVIVDVLGNPLVDLLTNSSTDDVLAEGGSTTPSTNQTVFWHDSFYRHSVGMTVLYCVAYIVVFIVGLIGNCFVIAVVYRSPRMRTVTNFFIVNLAVADILVIVFCLPATLMSNIFVREYFFNEIHIINCLLNFHFLKFSDEKYCPTYLSIVKL